MCRMTDDGPSSHNSSCNRISCWWTTSSEHGPMRHVLLPFCVVLSALAQPPVSRLEGIVEDPSGGAVIGARIKAENQLTGFNARVLSDSQGFYVFLSLPPGRYSVAVEATGF